MEGGCRGEAGEDGESLEQGSEGEGTSCEVITICERIEAFAGEGREQGVDAEYEEQWGEGASLLDAASYVDVYLAVHEDGRNAGDIGEEAFHDVDEPGGGIDFAQDCNYPSVRDGIKGFGEIGEEDVVLFITRQGGIIPRGKMSDIVEDGAVWESASLAV